MKILGLALAVAVTAGAIALRGPGGAAYPDALAAAALDQTPPDVQTVIHVYASALQGDPANPYRWSDLGSAFEAAQEISQARACYSRALELSGEIPQIWLRDANFHIQAGDPENALHSAGRVLRTVPDYDSVLFGYFDRLGLGTDAVLAEIGNDRRAMYSYARYHIGRGEMDQAAEVWKHVAAKGFADDTLAASYIDALLSSHRDAEAWRDWIEYLGARRGDYPDDNLLFNAGFEKEPTGSAFDWRIRPSDQFDTMLDASAAHEGSRALRIRFHGTENVSYGNVIQAVGVTPGKYTFEAWVRTENITTNEGPRIELFDPESPAHFQFSTDPFIGTVSWKPVRQIFTVPVGEKLLALRIVRRVSQKIDSKINGEFWMDSMRILRNR
jgi:tetratricopeptide (TPR) repeat protein